MENMGVRPPDTGTPVTAVKSRAPISLNTIILISFDRPRLDRNYLYL